MINEGLNLSKIDSDEAVDKFIKIKEDTHNSLKIFLLIY